MDAILSDLDNSLSLHLDWLTLGLSDIFDTFKRNAEKSKEEIRHKDSLVAGLESKIRKIQKEQEDIREKERMMTTECEGLKEKIRCKDDER
jgi:hypothetical protein